MKIGPDARDAGLDVVVLDRGDEPDVGIVEEGLKVRAADGLADLAVWSSSLGDRRQVNRAELSLEMSVGRAQPDLRPTPGKIACLSAQDVANGVANLDEAPDDARVPRRYAVRAFAVADRNGDGHAVDNLGEPVFDDEVAALLDRRALGGGSDADGLVGERLALEPRRGWSRKMSAGSVWSAASRSWNRASGSGGQADRYRSGHRRSRSARAIRGPCPDARRSGD